MTGVRVVQVTYVNGRKLEVTISDAVTPETTFLLAQELCNASYGVVSLDTVIERLAGMEQLGIATAGAQVRPAIISAELLDVVSTDRQPVYIGQRIVFDAAPNATVAALMPSGQE